MSQNNFVRQAKLEDSFLDMHKIKPIVSYCRVSGNEYKIMLVHNDKVAVLCEKLKGGLTDVVTLTIEGNEEKHKCMFDAEVKATEYLRS